MPRTLSHMRAVALDMADVTGDAHIDTQRVNDWFNLELAGLTDLYISSDENYFRSKVTIPIVAGQRSYIVPPNLYKITKLYFKGTDGRRIPMDRVNLDQLDASYNMPWNTMSSAPRYAFVERTLELTQASTAGTMELWFVPSFVSLVDDNQRIDEGIPIGHEDWVILGVAIRCRIKEESDPSALQAKRDQVENRIVALMSPRDQGEADQVRRVHQRGSLRYHPYARRW